MASVVMIIRKSDVIKTIQELLDQIEENKILVRIMNDEEFDLMMENK